MDDKTSPGFSSLPPTLKRHFLTPWITPSVARASCFKLNKIKIGPLHSARLKEFNLILEEMI